MEHYKSSFRKFHIYQLDPGNFTPGYVLNLSRELLDLDYPVTWLTSPHLYENDFPLPGGLQVQISFFSFQCLAPLKVSRKFWALRKIRKLLQYPLDLHRLLINLRSHAPGILHVHWALWPIWDYRLWKSLQKSGWKVFYTLHDPRPLKGTLPWPLTRHQFALARQADKIVVHEEKGRELLCRSGLQNDQVQLTVPAAPLLHDSSDGDKVAFRKALNLPVQGKIILFFGFIKQYKGFDVLLAALKLLKGNAVEFLALVAGVSLSADRKYYRRIRQLELSDRLRWDNRYVPESLVEAYFKAADVLALPYLAASSSGVLLNALACGLPVVGSDVEGINDLVRNNESALLVPSGDPIALSEALQRLIDDSSLAKRVAYQGLLLTKKNYSWKCAGMQIATLYNEMAP